MTNGKLRQFCWSLFFSVIYLLLLQDLSSNANRLSNHGFVLSSVSSIFNRFLQFVLNIRGLLFHCVELHCWNYSWCVKFLYFCLYSQIWSVAIVLILTNFCLVVAFAFLDISRLLYFLPQSGNFAFCFVTPLLLLFISLKLELFVSFLLFIIHFPYKVCLICCMIFCLNVVWHFLVIGLFISNVNCFWRFYDFS